MAVLAANKQGNKLHPDGVIRRRRYRMGTDIVYKGGIASLVAGLAVSAADTAAHTVIGVTEALVDNSGPVAGTFAQFLLGHGEFAATSITDAMQGTLMYVVDDQTFDDTLGTNGIVAGTLYQRTSNTLGFITFDGIMRGNAPVSIVATDLAEVITLANEIRTLLRTYR